jgi:DNA-binding beta-propeller fold protein YncE
VSPEKNNLLVLEKANPSGSGFSQNNDNVYYVTDDSVFAIDKKSGKKSEIFKNDNYWEKAVATAPYQANLYVLDTKNGVLKFIPSGNNFDKNDYLKQSASLDTAVSMAIDSAVWVLFLDGSIKKYLRGEAENFSVKSLDKPFANPTKLATDADTQNLYILDRGNSRIVKLGKDGTFQKQYSAGIIKNAKDFEVLEKDKKINILSGEKIYQIVID